MYREISSASHPLVKHLVRLRDDAPYREAEGRVLVQGRKVVHELAQERVLGRIFCSDARLLPSDVGEAEVLLCPEGILHKVAGVVTPDGIVAEARKPVWASLQGLRRVVALDGVADPGNVGTLIRTALALGWEAVYLLEGSCDPFNDKALRSSMGAAFHLPLAKGSWKELRELCQREQWSAVAADLQGGSVQSVEGQQKLLLVLGAEGRGLSSEAKELCQLVSIPMSGHVESLNVSVAGGILMYALGTR